MNGTDQTPERTTSKVPVSSSKSVNAPPVLDPIICCILC